MQYFKARVEAYNNELSYQIYVTDALNVISTNTIYHSGGFELIERGGKMSKRWIDLHNDVAGLKEDQDDRPCEEIVKDIWNRAGFTQKEIVDECI